MKGRGNHSIDLPETDEAGHEAAEEDLGLNTRDHHRCLTVGLSKRRAGRGLTIWYKGIGSAYTRCIENHILAADFRPRPGKSIEVCIGRVVGVLCNGLVFATQIDAEYARRGLGDQGSAGGNPVEPAKT